MKIIHKAYKKEVNVSALADARQVVNPSAETVAETEKLLNGLKALTYGGHKGSDTWSNWGSQIFATHDGIVSWSVDEGSVGGGVWLEITRTGLYSYRNPSQDGEQYKHLRRGSVVVKKGQKVVEGQLLGIQGRTGNSTGEHLHYEVIRNGKRVDPLPYMKGEEIEMKLYPYNEDNNDLLMVTAGGFMSMETAQEVLKKVLTALPELRPYAGIRFSPSSSAGKYQVTLCRLESTLVNAKKLVEEYERRAGLTIEFWGW